nr:retrovirus-related Pol polyprotein from transposon TNT 1-94 [Tanacetum cinerariifolium]
MPVTLGSVGPTAAPGQETTLSHAFTIGTPYDPTSGVWNFDTGVSSHLNNSVNSLSEPFNACMYPSVSVGDGHSIPVTNTGHSILPTSVRPLHLNNVLITPHIVKNLIFVRQFVHDNNCTIEFDAFGFFFKDFMTRRVLLRCYSTGLPLPGHASFSNPSCFPCHYSQFVWIYPLLNKYDVWSKFILFRTYVRTQFKCEIRSFQCDHSGEFDNRNLHKLFVENGIQFRFSCPKTSQQNGKSERMVRTINNLIRTLLFQANLPPTIWVEALNMATHLLNILPSTAIINEIPYTRLFRKQSDYSLLCTFGCLCYHHLYPNHKLKPCATPSILLGYASNHRGYRCLDLKTNTIIISRHVTFDESVFLWLHSTSFTTYLYLFRRHTRYLLPVISTNPAVQLPLEPITLIHNTKNQAHLPRQLSPDQVQTTKNQAHSPPPSTSAVQQQTPTTTQSSATQHEPVDQPHVIIPDPPENPNPVSVHLMVIRFRVGTNRPTKRLTLHVSLVSPLPKSYRDAFSDPNWQNAMHGMLSRYKARLVANGITQLKGVDVDATFSPVVKPGIIQTVLSLTASRHWLVHQLDVKNAFFAWPFEFSFNGLHLTLHGLAFLIVIVTPPYLSTDRRIIRSLHQKFAMTDLGQLNYFLSIFVTRDSFGLFLSQKKYAVEILEKAYMVNCNPSRTLVDTESKLGVDGDPVSDMTLYWSLAVLSGYYALCLQLFSSSTTDLVAYSDADWAECPTTWRSISGYCVFLGNNLLSWSSKRQPMLSNSSAESEYRGVANAVAETCWLRNLLRELHTLLSYAKLVYCDNVSAVYLSCNPVQHQRTKHIEIDIHFVCDLVAAG